MRLHDGSQGGRLRALGAAPGDERVRGPPERIRVVLAPVVVLLGGLRGGVPLLVGDQRNLAPVTHFIEYGDVSKSVFERQKCACPNDT